MASAETCGGEEVSLKAMQTDLHIRGTNLSKAWTDLFTLLSKYQAELTVKENEIDIADKQVEARRQQINIHNDKVSTNSEETEILREQLYKKEILLSKCQEELSHSTEMFQRVQSDLSRHTELLDEAGQERIQIHDKLIGYKTENAKLRAELKLKVGEISVKDSLVDKLQKELVKETNDLQCEISKLKDRLKVQNKILTIERKAHDETKKLLTDHVPIGRSRDVLEIPESSNTTGADTVQNFMAFEVDKQTVVIQNLEQNSEGLPQETNSVEKFSLGTPAKISMSPKCNATTTAHDELSQNVFFPLEVSESQESESSHMDQSRIDSSFDEEAYNIMSDSQNSMITAESMYNTNKNDEDVGYILQKSAPVSGSSPRSKRGHYQHYGKEFRLTVGKYATDYGNVAAIKTFSTGQKSINESTIRMFKKKYQDLVKSGELNPTQPIAAQLENVDDDSKSPCMRCKKKEEEIEELNWKISFAAQATLESEVNGESDDKPIPTPRPGIVPPSIAQRFKMVPLVEGYCVYLFQHQKSAALKVGLKGNKLERDGGSMARHLLSLFFSKDELVWGCLSKTENAVEKNLMLLNPAIVKAILDFCLANSPNGRGKIRSAMQSKLTSLRAKLRTWKRTDTMWNE